MSTAVETQTPPKADVSSVKGMRVNAASSKRKSHLHSLHHSHRHGHHRSSRHHAKELVQSAFPSQPPTSFGDLLKQAKESITSSPADSRRQSVAVVGASPEGTAEGDAQEEARGDGLEPLRRRPGRPEDLVRERRRAKMRGLELRASLQSLSDQSLKTSRRLDDTYYSLLERVAQCRQTVGSLQELANLTSELHQNFQTDMGELAEDIEGQLEGFGGFEAQTEQVEKLEGRIKVGKEKATALAGRLEEAKRRVDARMKSEAELEARNTRHMRILWSIIGSTLGLILLLILFQQLKPVHPRSAHKHDLDFASRDQILNAPIPDIAKEVIMSPTKEQLDVRIASPSVRPTTNVEADHLLRAFDEL
ncbi:hypothetical protein BU23DRAFT_579302 [Bimuria novae-zelandiae CBS 107.79]|uniref:Uncharacterized protein n=1 Tax=Bimuria novae-zelandiae CBS 107.79 TaxID=1447943 RepID=A0A6A5VES0_9PLEO|nr:hypothetical protein BU23DRAFT_579302 [Bimuria novae-zelandiae CBS 107.79]